jgi:hypothetical protein
MLVLLQDRPRIKIFMTGFGGQANRPRLHELPGTAVNVPRVAMALPTAQSIVADIFQSA